MSVFDSIEEIENIEFFKNNSEEWVSVRDKLLLSLIYSCGLRISEAINLNYDDINFKSQFVRIKGKGDKERIVPIIADILESIEHLCKLCPYFDKSKKIIFYGKQGDRLHPTVFQKTLREVKKILNLPEGTTPHAFRHSFATHLLSSSKDLLSIKELMGHSSISTTQKYTKIEASDMLSAFSEMD